MIQNVKEENDSQEVDELLMKIYSENFAVIESSSAMMQYGEITSMVSFLVFLMCIAVKLSPLGNFSWVYLNIPGIISLLSLTFTFNMFLRLKDLIDKAELKIIRKNTEEQPKKTGLVYSFIVLNLIGISLIVFIFVLSLRLDGKISPKKDINLVFIPLYIAIILSVSYAIFISPAFFNQKLIFEIILIFLYIISALLFVSLLSENINNNVKTKRSRKKYFCFIPFYITFCSHLVYLVAKIIIAFKENLIGKIMVAGGIALFLSGCITANVKLNRRDYTKHYGEAILFILGFVLICGDTIVNFFYDRQEKEREEIKDEIDKI